MADLNPDRFTETSTTSWLSRIGNSFVGIIVGLILIPVAIVLLSWNEGRAVTAYNALKRGAGSIVEVSSSTVDPKNNQQLVYVSGEVGSAKPALDPLTGLSTSNLLRLERKVEMYQWQEQVKETKTNNTGGSQTTEKTYNYVQAWLTENQNSASFKVPAGHQNPQMDIKSQTFDASDVKLGAFVIDRPLVDKMTNFENVDGLSQAPAGFKVQGGMLYRGNDAAQPKVGDMRITYRAIGGQVYSIAALQKNGSLAVYADPKNGYTIALVEPGVVTAKQLFADQNKTEGLMTWVFRVLGLVLMFVGFKLLFGPLEMLVAFLPFLESLVGFGTGLIAAGLALPITLITIAIAWIASRPLIGGGILVVALGIAVAFKMLSSKKPTVSTT
jgi:hypothetical protein